MALYRSMIDGKHIDAEPTLAHCTCHEILNSVFIASS